MKNIEKAMRMLEQLPLETRNKMVMAAAYRTLAARQKRKEEQSH